MHPKKFLYNYISSQTVDCSPRPTIKISAPLSLLNSCNGMKFTDENHSNKTNTRWFKSYKKKCITYFFVQKSYYKNHAKYLQAKLLSTKYASLGEKTADYTYKSSKCTQLNETCNKSVIHKPS